MKRTTHTLDASNIVPGRLATTIAKLLMGKHKADYQPNIDMGDLVVVEHSAAMKFSSKKLATKAYYRHSGYPGGLTKTFAKDMTMDRILWEAVYNMLPKNRLRAVRLKRLTIR